jgi:hypothetical protein
MGSLHEGLGKQIASGGLRLPWSLYIQILVTFICGARRRTKV